MPVRLDSDSQQRHVIFLTFKIPWNWDELTVIMSQIDEVIAGMPKPVHLILDVSSAGHPPTGALQHLSSLMESARPMRGSVLVVGADRLMYTLLMTLIRVSHHTRQINEIQFFDTLDAAQNKILSL